MQRIGKDSLAGATFVALGLAFAIASSQYTIGTALRMGPGYFPLVLGGVLVVFGALIVVKGIVAPDADDVGPVPWRSLGLLVAAVLFFGFAVQGLGLVPTLFVTIFLAAFAGFKIGAVRAAVIAGGLTALCYLIFVLALQLRLPLFGPWVGA